VGLNLWWDFRCPAITVISHSKRFSHALVSWIADHLRNDGGWCEWFIEHPAGHGQRGNLLEIDELDETNTFNLNANVLHFG
jgi:Spy/CpxP family protein refolding chaperone